MDAANNKNGFLRGPRTIVSRMALMESTSAENSCNTDIHLRILLCIVVFIDPATCLRLNISLVLMYFDA
ncbi:hypothetical protein DPMN_052477 [Dreissena polymorpha]|uniref:Uncharacterized protein n=1 Tax=Dreissena polymorpha TaxID=45954 RepID=A0A9D4HPX1_DREPO|nr:hypothetical protein DPMN_052477 [Dreissena polymorpha]